MKPKKKFKHSILISQKSEQKKYLFVAIDRTSKFTYVELHKSATKPIAAEFLRNLIRILPYKIHTVLTDNGIQFTNQKRHKHAFQHIFDRVCEENGIEHRLTKVRHPWTNGQVERMNKTLKNATVKLQISSATQKVTLLWPTITLKDTKLLMVLHLLNLYVYSAPDLFILNPYHHTLGPYT